MPFPWKKKTRVTRISRIVADLQTPKRGGSLVVQTGFPTSLIDLFVKNRSRFARPKPKKPPPPDIPDPPPPPPSPAATPPPHLPLPPIPAAEPPSIQANTVTADDATSSGRVRECESGSGSRFVGVAVRILVVVVSIASAKRLTIGITVSAFALLLLEYAAKRAVWCSRPCSNVAAESPARAWFQRLLIRLKPNKKEPEAAIFQGEAEPKSNPSLYSEIEVVETNNSEERCCHIGPELVEEVDDGCSKEKVVVDEFKTSGRGSRGNFSFKSKMVKKLVPKKFRSSKKVKGSGVSIAVAVDRNNGSQLLVNKCELECIRDYNDDDDEDEVEVDIGISGCEESSLVREEVIGGRVGNSGYKILVVIALAGLVVGRFQALILIMVWCFMLKIVKTLWRSQTLGVPTL